MYISHSSKTMTDESSQAKRAKHVRFDASAKPPNNENEGKLGSDAPGYERKPSERIHGENFPCCCSVAAHDRRVCRALCLVDDEDEEELERQQSRITSVDGEDMVLRVFEACSALLTMHAPRCSPISPIALRTASS